MSGDVGSPDGLHVGVSGMSGDVGGMSGGCRMRMSGDVGGGIGGVGGMSDPDPTWVRCLTYAAHSNSKLTREASNGKSLTYFADLGVTLRWIRRCGNVATAAAHTHTPTCRVH